MGNTSTAAADVAAPAPTTTTTISPTTKLPYAEAGMGSGYFCSHESSDLPILYATSNGLEFDLSGRPDANIPFSIQRKVVEGRNYQKDFFVPDLAHHADGIDVVFDKNSIIMHSKLGFPKRDYRKSNCIFEAIPTGIYCGIATRGEFKDKRVNIRFEQYSTVMHIELFDGYTIYTSIESLNDVVYSFAPFGRFKSSNAEFKRLFGNAVFTKKGNNYVLGLDSSIVTLEPGSSRNGQCIYELNKPPPEEDTMKPNFNHIYYCNPDDSDLPIMGLRHNRLDFGYSRSYAQTIFFKKIDGLVELPNLRFNKTSVSVFNYGALAVTTWSSDRCPPPTIIPTGRYCGTSKKSRFGGYNVELIFNGNNVDVLYGTGAVRGIGLEVRSVHPVIQPRFDFQRYVAFTGYNGMLLQEDGRIFFGTNDEIATLSKDECP